jgi:hypothetical protein
MRNLPLEDHIIGIAKILNVSEKDVMQAIYDAFENTSDEADEILDDAYWEFQDDNKSPKI